MSSIPQETIDKIKINAAKATNKRDEQLRERSKDYGRRLAFLDGYEEGHNAGATEWAGKAQPVVELMETTISILSVFIEPALFNQQVSNEQRILINTRREIETALAKYKEVTNG